ncbi:MAG: MBL fold metallo-hydrolase [Clostridiales Family XIII bacterium]|jgi:glyoxylase-like metal-dependent hydrolase (beta-lactamase superfamily II)|nr:MBL fold metallo-hydrolase [Clostridiales Family XIII bacterium]
MIKVKKVKTGIIEENCYLVYDKGTKCAAIIDPGEGIDQVIDVVDAQNLNPEIIINTHGHYDHISDDDKIRLKYKIPLAIHKDEVEMIVDPKKNASFILGESLVVKFPEILLEDSQDIKLSFTTFKVLSTPGHSKGSICLLCKPYLFTGDTLFAGAIGRTDLWGGSNESILQSLEKLKKLDPFITVCPGHGSMTTLANEFKHNPFLIR